jgi:hypothetical protein
VVLTVELLYEEIRKGKENDRRTSVISHNLRWEGREYKNAY